MTAPVFVVERMPTGPEFVLDGPEGRHAVSVKRLQPGEDVVLTDGLGHWADGVVRAARGCSDIRSRSRFSATKVPRRLLRLRPQPRAATASQNRDVGVVQVAIGLS